MNASGFRWRASGAVLAIAMTGGCGAGSLQQTPSAGSLSPATLPRGSDAALTAAHDVSRAAHPDRGRSWMRPDKKSGTLLYVGDWNTNDVFVYDFPSVRQVGQLTGFDEPYGTCVNSKGDVYIANFGSGTLVEYAPGAAKPLKTFSPGGEPIGCSVNPEGDVSATSFSPNEVTVYALGNPDNGTTYSNSSCEYGWPMGYDDKGNLIGESENTSIEVCALLAGTKAITVLTESGIVIDFPGGTSWDGKYIALGDQEAGGTFKTGVWPSTLSGTTITAATKEVVFTDDCYSDYTDVVNPFFLSKSFTPVTPDTHKRAKYMIGANLWCADAGSPGVTIWQYPSGKLYKSISLGSGGPTSPYGVAVTVSK